MPSRLRVAAALALAVPASACAASPGVGEAAGRAETATTGEPIEAGIPDGARLEVREGPTMRVTEDGAVVEGLDLSSPIWVMADDVTIRNTRVTYGGYHSIRVFHDSDGTVVENVEINCTDHVRTKGIVFGDYLARGVEVNGCRRPFVGGSDVTIEGSLVDGRRYDTASGEPMPGRSWWCVGSLRPLCGGAVGESWAPPPTTAPPTTAPPTTAPPTTAAPAPDESEPDSPSGPAAALGGFPTAASTGFNACGRSVGELEPMSGSITLRDGETLENFDLSGSITVEGPNVTIRCGRIRSSGMYAITASREGDESYTVDAVQMIGTATDSARNSAAIAPYGDWVASRVDISRFRDGIKVGSHQTIEESWIHDLWKTDGAHNDGVQSVGGTDVVIRGNNIEGPWRQSTSALILASENSPLRNYTIANNRLSGGGYTLYVGGSDGEPTPQNIEVTNNTFVDGSATYGFTSFRLNWPAGDSGATIGGNIVSTGAPLGIG